MNIIRLIDRVLWGTHMGSLTSPTHWGRCPHCGELLPWVTSTSAGAYACPRCGDHSSDPAKD